MDARESFAESPSKSNPKDVAGRHCTCLKSVPRRKCTRSTRPSRYKMRRIHSQCLLGLALGLIISTWSHLAGGQLAPTGGHYAGRASDTGYEPGAVNASGGYTASAPLEFPPARGGLPLPLQLVSGTRGLGAAGLGWDIPLSYVRRDTSFAHRRPAIGSDVAPQVRTQVSLSLQGRRMQLVPNGSVWVSQHDSPELTLREQNGAWVMYDGRGLTYAFTRPPALAGAGLWLLDSVKGPGGTAVELEYNITTPALPGGPGVFGVSIDLVRIQYNFLVEHGAHGLKIGCAKNEVTLTYDEPSPLSISLVDDVALARTNILSAIDVTSRAS